MRKGLAAAGVVALITAGSAACGADKTTPQGKVGDAFQKLGGQNTVTLGLGFSGSADQIYASMKNEDDFTRDDAKLLSSLHLTLAASSQKSFSVLGKSKSAKGGAASFALSTDDSGGKPLAEVRAVGQKAYLRIDIKGLEKLDTSSSDSGSMGEINQFVDGADQLPASLASVKAALKGQWVSIDPKAFASFAKSLGGSSDSAGSGSSGSATPTLNANTEKQVVAGLRKALSANATYTDLGTKNGADHVKVTVAARQFTKDAATDLAPVLKQIPDFKASDLTDAENAKGVPDKNLSVDVAIKNGSISTVSFDVAQLDSQATGALPLTLTLDGSAKPISAPAGAQVLNPQDIIGLVMSGAGGGSDDSSSSSSSVTSSF
jgi:hypothetical protein